MPHPPIADLAPAPEPQLASSADADIDAFDIAHEAWGRTEHGKLARICQWTKDFIDPSLSVECKPDR